MSLELTFLCGNWTRKNVAATHRLAFIVGGPGNIDLPAVKNASRHDDLFSFDFPVIILNSETFHNRWN